MRNFLGDGKTVTISAPHPLASGEGCQVGTMFGIAGTTTPTGGRAVLHVEGVYSLPKPSNLSLSFGSAVSWSVGDIALRAPAAGALRIGYAVQPAPAGTTTAQVRLTPRADGPDA